MKSLTGGDDYGFNEKYDGLSVSGSFTFEDDIIQSISLNYFYNTCGGAKSLLSDDKKDIKTAITNALLLNQGAHNAEILYIN